LSCTTSKWRSFPFVFTMLLFCLCVQQTHTPEQGYQSSACFACSRQAVSDMESQETESQVSTSCGPSPCAPFFSDGASRGRSVQGAPGSGLSHCEQSRKACTCA
jgi:hypothetical protein